MRQKPDSPPLRPITDEDWLMRVRSEYLEMPGLSLTQVQAQRLWGLDAKACDALLGALVKTGFLRRTTHGGYVRTAVA